MKCQKPIYLAGLCALGALAAPQVAFAQVTVPSAINGAYPTGTLNLGGSTNGTQNTTTLTNLGENQGVTFDFEGQITDVVSPLVARWNSGFYFPNATTMGIQIAGTNVPDGDSGTYTVTFSRTVYGLSFRMDDINFHDSFLLSAYDDANNLVPLSVAQHISAIGSELAVTQQGDSLFVEETDGTTTAGQISVNFDAGLSLGIRRLVFSRVGKDLTNYNANTTLFFTAFGWDVQKDYSDAPISYGNATHRLASGINLGSLIDIETVSLASAAADGDDTNGSDDEDGVSSLPPLTVGSTTYTIPAANISAVGTGTLHAWVDFNNSGTFDVSEHSSVAVAGGALASDLQFTGLPALTAGNIFARFRLTSDGAITSATPAGVATNGEVEDYLLPITLSADLEIAKSDGVATVFSGSTSTYTLTVTNNGPSPVTGAVVTDTPVAGLTCPAGNPVTIAGSGVPAGSFTVGNLTGAGIALGTLLAGQSTTLTFDCEVN